MSIKTLYDYFRKEGMNEFGAVGFLCNIGGESEFKANNAQNCGNKSLGMTDAEYTKALDNGSIPKDAFVNKHKWGYGLCQWTYPSRKAAFYDFMKKNASSFGDEMKQAEFIVKELKTSYKSVWNFLCNATSVREASDLVLKKYEQPADQGEGEQKRRFAYAERIYNEISAKTVKIEMDVLKRGANGEQVKTLQRLLIAMGYSCGSSGVDGSFGPATASAVNKYQNENHLAVDGCVGAATWTALLN